MEQIRSTMLNQTNISYGSRGNNKFYQLQLFRNNNVYELFIRYGRVGTKGTLVNHSFDNINDAEAKYDTLFKSKTGNKFGEPFKPKKGKYILVEIEQNDDIKIEPKITTKIIESKLDIKIQNLIDLIGNVKMMQDAMTNFNIDIKKMPLGKLSKTQIANGYDILKLIQNKLDIADYDTAELSSMFYSTIPHDFGYKKPLIINSIDLVKLKMDMLEVLTNIEIASKIISKDYEFTNPIDNIYNNLNAEITPVAENTEEFKQISSYMATTHSPKHDDFNCSIINLFRLNRKNETANFKILPNRQLLWHGSKIVNFISIISQGLRIAPQNAPCTGYMFGKGIYFANMFSKSANYCNTIDDVGCILLAEVALGESLEKTNSYYVTTLADDKQSCHGIGEYRPSSYIKHNDGYVIPMGPIIARTNYNGSLIHDEFIVYDISQVKLKYILQIKFER